MKFVTCNKCNTVSMAVSRDFAQEEVKSFNEYYLTLPAEEKKRFSGMSKLENYTCILCCGSDFRPFTKGDCPSGCTLSPVIYEEKE